MKTILVTAYAVNPYKGSEDGTGWNLIMQIARFNKVIAITRKNNRDDIEKFSKASTLTDNIIFEYFDLPYWMRFWKRKNKGALIYFYLWQLFMPLFIKLKKIKFDIAHNLNFHSDWTPSFLWMLNKPFVWGPVGHHPKIKKEFLLNEFGKKALLQDRIKWYTKLLFWYIDPFVRIAASRANLVLAINSSVESRLNTQHKTIIIPAVGTDDMQGIVSSQNIFRVISVGRFVPLKGFDICIKSFAAFRAGLPTELQKNVRLTLIGKGPSHEKLKELIKTFNLEAVTEWVEWIDRQALKKLYASSSVFLFPSHEGAGMVIPEALSNGLPVLCFNNYGPGELITTETGYKIPYTNYATAVTAFAEKLIYLFTHPEEKNKMSINARQLFLDKYDWSVKGEQLQKVYAGINV